MTHPNSPKGALLRTVKDSAGAVVLEDATLDQVCDFCKRNGLYLPE